ncbi:MAG TPA: MarR family transcriptional regulator [Ktedonobacteraceae bacterium]|jgi:DNA-binding MarR family transcriptional regulator|nr:MarR family transcriptional regulator [Ktedonobacteraceae bacterium]
MSSGSEEKRMQLLGELARELRQFTGLGASFFRAAAARIGITVTDMQVIDVLHLTGPMTAGQLADLTGLTTGAITGMLNRLEEAGLLCRERDPNDGRRVIVRLVANKDEMQKIDSIFDSLGDAWDDMAARYNEEQLAFLLEFLRGSNTLTRKEIVRLRETPDSHEGVFSAPLGDLMRGRLVVSSGVSRLTLRTSEAISELYQARFEGTPPGVTVKDGVVTVRYPRRLWMLSAEQRAAEITLNATIPWWIVIQGGTSVVEARLDGLHLAGLEITGGLSMIHLELPDPSGVVPVRISGGASTIFVQRPEGVSARAHLKGWVSTFDFDDQHLSDLGNNVWLQSPGFDPNASYYDIEVASSASTVTITSG